MIQKTATKPKIIFACSECDHRPPKWVGCCPECRQWNTVQEVTEASKRSLPLNQAQALTRLDDISIETKPRMFSGINEWDTVMGGGIMPGSLIILTGDPGIGKSTLLLQIADKLAHAHTVFYFSSEESLQQVKLRAQRLHCKAPSLFFSDQAHLESILATTHEQKPDIIIVDSIQNCYSEQAHIVPGSMAQLRDATFAFLRLAKEQGISVILTGHITKEGVIAGPKMLEHMVDAVFYLQGEDRWQTRILRSVKNRFGTIAEVGFFEMCSTGLKEVPNINEQLLGEASFSPGSCLISHTEGSRPLLIELQALTIPSKFAIPQRVISGVDQKQVIIITAILEKYLHIPFSSQDIFFKVGGGFKIKESSMDLGIALGLLSSYFQKPLPDKSLALGEIGLTGIIKPINQISMHITEAQKFGIRTLLLAKNQRLENKCTFKGLQNVYELLTLFE